MFLNSKLRFSLATALLTCFDGDDDPNAGGDDAGEKKFTQEDLNSAVANEKRQFKAKQLAMAQELTELKQSKSLTDEEKDKLQAKIEDLQAQYMTAEERARRATEEAEQKAKDVVNNLTTERDAWKAKHANLVVQTAIAHAADEHGAWKASQISAIVSPMTKLVEVLDDDGNPTGDLVPRVSFPDKNKSGEDIILELTVSDAVKRMRELPDQHGNLFRESKTSGMGQTGSTGGEKKVDINKVANDAAAYRRLRAEKPELFV